MQGKTVGTVLLVLGVALAVVSVLADTLGLGGAPGFGYKQIAGLAAGVVIAAVGLSRLRRERGGLGTG